MVTTKTYQNAAGPGVCLFIWLKVFLLTINYGTRLFTQVQINDYNLKKFAYG